MEKGSILKCHTEFFWKKKFFFLISEKESERRVMSKQKVNIQQKGGRKEGNH
jgi:hypothetical protein